MREILNFNRDFNRLLHRDVVALIGMGPTG